MENNRDVPPLNKEQLLSSLFRFKTAAAETIDFLAALKEPELDAMRTELLFRFDLHRGREVFEQLLSGSNPDAAICCARRLPEGEKCRYYQPMLQLLYGENVTEKNRLLYSSMTANAAVPGISSFLQWITTVVFNGVDFGYNDEKIVLHDIKLYAKPGQKIAFVGSTGAGKTTITNLINRFYDIQDGKIRYDGININKIKKADLRHSLGIVLQDTHLFTGTVRDNIRFGKLDATDEEIVAAAKLANADSFIRRLPKGYDTMLTGDGANLSQGQRQLLAIARAAIADPPVLILDEATSSIDTRTERIVQDGMDKLMRGRTTFVIAHRLSTVRNSDCIMVLEQGRIIERGTHDELIEEKGRYYQLYTGNAISA